MDRDRLEYALERYIKENYFLPTKSSYLLKENQVSGKSELSVTISGENLCIDDFDRKDKCAFVAERNGMRKSVDHIILQYKEDAWIAHLIELKTTIDNSKWVDVKQKNRSSYFTIKAIAVFLGIELKGIFSYTSYEREVFMNVEETTNPKLYMPMLGKKLIDYKKDEWDVGIISFEEDANNDIKLQHKAIKMIRVADVLKGELSLV